MAQPKEVKQAKELHKEKLLQKDLVVGVGTGYKVSRGEQTDELCIVTMVRQKVPKSGLNS